VEDAGIKTTSPQICCCITLQKVILQLYSFAAQLIQIKSDAKVFNYTKYINSLFLYAY